MMALLLGTGCAKKTPESAAPAATVPMVKETERSKNFIVVSKQLELGGPLYAYVDVEGDVLKMAAQMNGLLGQVAATQPDAANLAKQDFAAIAGILGLTDVKAFGMSSVEDGPGFYRNQIFFHLSGERHGLLAGLGGKPGPFKHLQLAPANASFYGESELDLAVVYRTIKEVVAKVAGETAGNELEANLKKAGENAALSVLDLIYGFKGHSAVVLRLDGEKTFRLPPPAMTLPAFSLLLCIEGIAPVIEASLAKSPVIRRSEAGALRIYELAQTLPVEGLQPVIVADGSTLYFATTRAFYDECRAPKPGLAKDPQFEKALARVGNEGNGLSYVSPELFAHLRRIPSLNARLPAESARMMAFVMSQLPAPDQPMVAIRTNLPEGILIRSHLNRTLKQEAAMFTIYNPVTVGLVAAMAIPAFQKVRVASQEKAVVNNLRVLSAAAEQFYLEQGVRAANYNDLVGPTRLVKEIRPVSGEDYRQVRFVQGQPLRVVLADGRAIQYPPGPAMQKGTIQKGSIKKNPPVKKAN
jgi:type IV pilus assembly protein PilA